MVASLRQFIDKCRQTTSTWVKGSTLPGKGNCYLQYLEANNLYSWVMSQNVPTGGFKWVENPDGLHIRKLAKKSGKGYLLEVDISYPDDSHDLHNDLPFMCQKMKWGPKAGSKSV